jgi:hydroxymethylbilane synthase
MSTLLRCSPSINVTRIRVGTRKSALALAQAEEVARRLRTAWPELQVDAVKFQTRGDGDQTSRLGKHGGKGGAFVKEIRAAMLSGEIEAAMHSLKDMPGNEETPGLILGALFEGDHYEDVLVVRQGVSVDEIFRSKGDGIKIGTNSVRRAGYVRRLLPASTVTHFRGAADTRIQKLDAGQPQKMPDGSENDPVDALVMARAGLSRLGLSRRIAYTFSLEEMLPAVGQGIIAVECLAGDWETRRRLSRIDDAQARLCATAEREVLWLLNGHCNSPIAGHASFADGKLTLRAAVIAENGEKCIDIRRDGPAERPRELGRAVGIELLAAGASELIEQNRPEE